MKIKPLDWKLYAGRIQRADNAVGVYSVCDRPDGEGWEAIMPGSVITLGSEQAAKGACQERYEALVMEQIEL